jgi:hypothetical protein
LSDIQVQVRVTVKVEQSDAKAIVGTEMGYVLPANVIKDRDMGFERIVVYPLECEASFGARQASSVSAAFIGRAIGMAQTGIGMAAAEA